MDSEKEEGIDILEKDFRGKACANKPEVKSVFGKNVFVTLDRPLGSYHPKHKDMYYPINYGYIEGIIAPDGEEQDAYILGIDVPVKTFMGKIIAVIHRNDDIEEKWVVCPENMNFSEEEIRKLVDFQEKYFDSHIRMK
ncbi:inorganic diphosphatase [uncultured Methanocorpusculum sp.]|nr:inorganic diphosphatase [uncultured Methanocorpusculum sp.]